MFQNPWHVFFFIRRVRKLSLVMCRLVGLIVPLRLLIRNSLCWYRMVHHFFLLKRSSLHVGFRYLWTLPINQWFLRAMLLWTLYNMALINIRHIILGFLMLDAPAARYNSFHSPNASVGPGDCILTTMILRIFNFLCVYLSTHKPWSPYSPGVGAVKHWLLIILIVTVALRVTILTAWLCNCSYFYGKLSDLEWSRLTCCWHWALS